MVISTDGLLWMGMTDDSLMFCATVRNITLWNLNQFYDFFAVARSRICRLSLAACENKTTRVVAEGQDSRYSSIVTLGIGQHEFTIISTYMHWKAVFQIRVVLTATWTFGSFCHIAMRCLWLYVLPTHSHWLGCRLRLSYSASKFLLKSVDKSFHECLHLHDCIY